jgi:hypothetical protein
MSWQTPLSREGTVEWFGTVQRQADVGDHEVGAAWRGRAVIARSYSEVHAGDSSLAL